MGVQRRMHDRRRALLPDVGDIPGLITGFCDEAKCGNLGLR